MRRIPDVASRRPEHPLVANAAADFREALFSPTETNGRVVVHLAKVLLQLQRSREAIPLLRGRLRGQVLERTEIATTPPALYHELLAQAFEAAGEADSAAAEYRVVAEMWKRADPALAARGHAAQETALKLERLRSH